MSASPVQGPGVDRRRELAVLIGTFLVSFLAFSLGFGSWKFGLGFVLLILVHELGHVFEARRQGLQVSLPTFIPFFGAYVTVRHGGVAPWRSALVSLAGPFVGGLGALAVWAAGEVHDSRLLLQLAYIGFLVNAANLLPVGFLDGGAVLRAISMSRRGWIRYENGIPVEAVPPDREHANLVTFLYVLLAAGLVAGVLALRHSVAL
ncbi:MAG TPA: site-2 protease family protein [Gaiellaceae bacterium]